MYYCTQRIHAPMCKQYKKRLTHQVRTSCQPCWQIFQKTAYCSIIYNPNHQTTLHVKGPHKKDDSLCSSVTLSSYLASSISCRKWRLSEASTAGPSRELAIKAYHLSEHTQSRQQQREWTVRNRDKLSHGQLNK